MSGFSLSPFRPERICRGREWYRSLRLRNYLPVKYGLKRVYWFFLFGHV